MFEGLATSLLCWSSVGSPRTGTALPVLLSSDIDSILALQVPLKLWVRLWFFLITVMRKLICSILVIYEIIFLHSINGVYCLVGDLVLNVVLSLSNVFKGQSVYDTRFVFARYTISNSSSDSWSCNHASFLVAPARFKIRRSASWSIRIVYRAPHIRFE